jgi:hypothetical protein
LVAGAKREAWKAMRRWLLLAYKVPRKPSASRVYVWRKLKRLGALSVQDGVWVLPDTPRSKEQFQWLAAEIAELKGEATLWDAGLPLAAQEQALARRFDADVQAGYRRILAAVKRKGADLAALSREFQEVQMRDFLQSRLGRQVREALLRAGKKSEGKR